MQDFKMSGSNMNELLTNMKAIKERIDDSYDELTRLMSRIESDKLWKGKECSNLNNNGELVMWADAVHGGSKAYGFSAMQCCKVNAAQLFLSMLTTLNLWFFHSFFR